MLSGILNLYVDGRKEVRKTSSTNENCNKMQPQNMTELLGWWNADEVDWWKEAGKIFPTNEDYNKMQLQNMTGLLADFEVKYLSYTNLAVFTVARIINDMLGISVFDYKSIFQDKSLNGVNPADEINTHDANILDVYGKESTTIDVYNNVSARCYVLSIIGNKIIDIYNTGIAYNNISVPNISLYLPNIVTIECIDNSESTIMLIADQTIGFDKLIDNINKFKPMYYSVIQQLVNETVNFINQEVIKIKNQQEMNSVMPSGPIEEKWKQAVDTKIETIMVAAKENVEDFDRLELQKQNFNMMTYFLKKGESITPLLIQ